MQPLKERIKHLIVETLMLQMSPQEIADDQTLFGPGSLGLDSVDALQLVVMLDKHFGVKIPDSNAARETLHSLATIVAAVERQLAGPTN
ncbi:MAG TPA: acyl carrier protein [Candidatus Binatia bacterium]|nr:acyl carrier protein [Candidatus Binatia bacterium]